MVLGGGLKALLMTLTPMSEDLAYVVNRIFAGGPQARTLYGSFIRTVIAFWTTLPVDHPPILTSWTVDFFQPSIGLYLLVFLLKLPLLVLDLLTGILIYRTAVSLGSGERKGMVAFCLWFLNPYVTLMTEMWGTVEILPTFLLFWAIASLRTRNGRVRAVITYAAATAIKLFPAILLPIFPPIFRPRSKFSLFLLLASALGISAYFGWVYLAGYNPWFQLKQYDLFTQNFDEYVISTANGVQVGLATIGLIIVYVLIAERWPRNRAPAITFDAVLLTLLVFIGLSSWFPQALIWLIPFLVLDVAVGKRNLAYLIVLLCSALFFDCVAFYSYFTASGNAFFFIPASTQLLKSAVAAYRIFANADANVLVGGPFTRSLFTVTSMIYASKLIEKRTGLISSLQTWLFRNHETTISLDHA
jgi:hypothetical protein